MISFKCAKNIKFNAQVSLCILICLSEHIPLLPNMIRTLFALDCTHETDSDWKRTS